MNYNDLCKHAETGDLLLFKETWWFSRLIQYFTNSKYSHCGIIIKDPSFTDIPLQGLYLLESTGFLKTKDAEDNVSKFGVQLTPLQDVFDRKVNVYWRKLFCERDENFYKTLNIIHSVVYDKPYDDVPVDWIKAKFQLQMGNVRRLNRFFCSSLCAFVYTCLGFLRDDTPWSIIAPCQLGTEEGDDMENLRFMNCAMDKEELVSK